MNYCRKRAQNLHGEFHANHIEFQDAVAKMMLLGYSIRDARYYIVMGKFYGAL